MSYLPEELLYIVFIVLPVKSLLRFRCVSKLWLKLIDSTYFTNLHSYHIKQNSKTIFLTGAHNHIDIPSVHALNFDVRNNTKAEAKNLTPPLFFVHSKVLACNNLICLVSKSIDRIVIWNPATRRQQEVSWFPSPCQQFKWSYALGFGYDYKTDDYKLVMLKFSSYCENKKQTCYTVHVYSLKSNTWSCGPTKNDLGNLRTTPGVHVDGVLHWVNSPIPLENKFEIVAFDLATKEWTMPPPIPPGPSTCLKKMILSNHHGSLCASFHYYTHVDMWVMKIDQRINIYWSKLFTIKDGNYYKSGLRIMSIGNLMKMNQQKVLIRFRDKLKWYDIEKEIMEDVDIFGASYFYNSLNYYEGFARV